jgi:hypothetical protein
MCIRDSFKTLEVLADDGVSAELKVQWCKQGTDSWSAGAVENIRILPGEYPFWRQHYPRGKNENEI